MCGGRLSATWAEAQTAAAAGLKRTLLKQTDGPTEGYVTVEMRVDIEPGAAVARHTHPGVKSGYRRRRDRPGDRRRRSREPEGGGRLSGPTGVPHAGVNGSAKTVLVATYVVEKGKPLASPA